MNIKNIIKRCLAAFMALAVIFNFCDVGFLSVLTNLTEAEAAVPTLNITEQWEKKKDELGWLDSNNKPTAAMWQDTSSMDVVWIDEDSVTVDGSSVLTAVTIGNINTSSASAYRIDSPVTKTDGTKSVDDYSYVTQTYGSGYAFDDDTYGKYYYTIEYDNAMGGYYRQYYVSTANQLNFLLYLYQSNVGTLLASTADVGTEAKVQKIGIKLLCSIDLGGADSIVWTGYGRNALAYLIEIDGDNNYIYNGYYSSSTAFTLRNSATGVIIHDTVFSNHFMGGGGGIFGNTQKYFYLNNVDFINSVNGASQSTSAIVFGYNYIHCYVNNCMIRNCYVRGSSHCGTFSSYNGANSMPSSSTYIDSSASTSYYYYTEIPQEYTDGSITYSTYEAVEQCMLGAATVNYDNYSSVGTTRTLTNLYPCIFQNSMAIDSAIYDTGDQHSGTFVACTQGNIIFKNCFTNSEIYANTRAGVFIGCCIGCSNGFWNNVDGEDVFTNSYFENCYSSGLLEGSSYEGGFIGSIYNDQRSDGSDGRGIVVCKNCYSTSSVGMQYSGRYVGGFVGLIVGNVGSTGSTSVTGGKTQHKFINCYAAGEVGGINIDVTVDDDNYNSIGGFFGAYVKRDNSKEYTSNDNIPVYSGTGGEVPFVLTNCYYDKQTTAMRERDIGNYNYQTSSSNCNVSYDASTCTTIINNGTAANLTGAYTLTSNKGVEGLADTQNIMNGSTWNYTEGYYPYLIPFTGEAADNFGDKAQTAELYTMASVATVFLDHWDSTMDLNGNIVETTDTTVYDTVRDITSKFEFTSGGNSGASSIGWQLDTERNDENGFTPKVGLPSGETGDGGFELTYNYQQDGNDKTTTKEFTPNVLGLNVRTENNDYTFECYDFAEGKQFVKVTTCLDDDYNSWEAEEAKYIQYTEDYNEYIVMKSTYISNLNLTDTAADDEITNAIVEKVRSLLSSKYSALAKRDIDDVLARLIDFASIMDATQSNLGLGTFELEEAYETAREELYNGTLPTGYTIENLYSDIVQFLNYNYYYENGFTFSEPTAVEQPLDFDTYVIGKFGTRSLRLIPMAYLNAGDTININVGENEIQGTSGGEPFNKITIAMDNETIYPDKFDHTIGVAYSSTQGMDSTSVKTRLGDSAIYPEQILAQNSSNYYDKSTHKHKNLGSESTGIFALYDIFPSIKDADYAETVDGADPTVTTGLGSLTPQVLLGDFYGDGAENIANGAVTGAAGLTKVDVFKTVYEDADNGYTLGLGDKIDMSDTDNLAKWSGQELFTSDDRGYYYMVYYWRLNDSRYLEEYKLVRITSNKFNVEMRTGVAGDTEDSFVYDDTGKVYYTAIDCDVFSGTYTSQTSGGTDRHYFPSELYRSAEDDSGNPYYSTGTEGEFETYAQTVYSTYGEYLDYNEATYWCKGIDVTSDAQSVSVAWKKDTDYALVKLMVEVEINGEWVAMAMTTNTDGSSIIGDETNTSFNYKYTSYSIAQNPKTKKFSVVATSNSVKSFTVSSAGDTAVGSGSIRYIDFQFIDSESYIEFNDNIRVTALFRKVSGEVSAEEDVLIDDGTNPLTNAAKDGDEYLSISDTEEYKSVDNIDKKTEAEKAYADKKGVLFGDTLIYRKKIQNIGVYDYNFVLVKEEVPDGNELVDGSVKLYRQERYLNRNGEDTFKQPEEIPLAQTTMTEAFGDYSDETYAYNVSDDKKEITCFINPVCMEYDYYVEFSAIAGSSNSESVYNDIYDTEKNTYNSQANYSTAYINGDTYLSQKGQSVLLGSNNEDYSKYAVYNVRCGLQTTDSNGNVGYEIKITRQSVDEVKQAIADALNDKGITDYSVDDCYNAFYNYYVNSVFFNLDNCNIVGTPTIKFYNSSDELLTDYDSYYSYRSTDSNTHSFYYNAASSGVGNAFTPSDGDYMVVEYMVSDAIDEDIAGSTISVQYMNEKDSAGTY